MTAEKAASTDTAKVTRDEPAISASYLVRVHLRPDALPVGSAPTTEQMEGAVEAGLRNSFPDFAPTARAERLDR